MSPPTWNAMAPAAIGTSPHSLRCWSIWNREIAIRRRIAMRSTISPLRVFSTKNTPQTLPTIIPISVPAAVGNFGSSLVCINMQRLPQDASTSWNSRIVSRNWSTSLLAESEAITRATIHVISFHPRLTLLWHHGPWKNRIQRFAADSFRHWAISGQIFCSSVPVQAAFRFLPSRLYGFTVPHTANYSYFTNCFPAIHFYFLFHALLALFSLLSSLYIGYSLLCIVRLLFFSCLCFCCTMYEISQLDFLGVRELHCTVRF